MKRLAIVATHPVQYNAPWFKLLTERGIIKVKVFYTWSQTNEGAKYDPDFKRVIEWDIPLLEGYDYEFVENISKKPGSDHFNGIDNPTLNKRIEQWKPDTILLIGWSYKSHLSCMRHFSKRTSILFRGDSTLLDEKPGLKTLLRRIFLTWVYRHIDYALYVGSNNKDYFMKHGVTESQLILAPHAIDIDRFSVSVEANQAKAIDLRKELAIKTTDFVILFAGKLEEKKNPFFILHMAKQIEDPEITFLIAGNGHLEEELKQFSKDDPRIKFLPFQNQSTMPAVYAAANVFILPSKGPGETWGLAGNESMAAGLPIMMSAKAGGAIDLVKDNGLVFDHTDIKSKDR